MYRRETGSSDQYTGTQPCEWKEPYLWPILVDAFGAPPGARATPIRQAPPPDIGLVTAGVLGFVDAARRIIREGWAPPDGNTAVMVYAPREIMKYIAGVWNPHHPALTAAAVEAS